MGRDKFAALASRASTNSSTSSGNNEASTQIPTPSVSSQASSADPPRRDKLAALAARNVSIPDAATATANTTSSAPTSTATASHPSGGRGNKFAALAAASTASNSADPSPANVPTPSNERDEQERLAEQFKQKLSKRDKLLQNLDRAEELTCNLLEIAHQTTTALQDLQGAPNLSDLSKQYRDTLREIHPLLSTDTQGLIHPYQNHARETKQSMYTARVEMRLAKERTQVLKDMTALERTDKEPSKKRSHEEMETTPAAT
eukprot:Nitzschia sp. Nitz4//scaffold3_size479765//279638//280417//NITZ4_000116-RA/size479765-processed-gene-1.464-mRNA-1//1//CDS//3329550806//5409//frame0